MENKNIEAHSVKIKSRLTNEELNATLCIDDETYCYEVLPAQQQIILRRKYQSYGKTESNPVKVFDMKKYTYIEQINERDRDARHFLVYEATTNKSSIKLYSDGAGWEYYSYGELEELASFENASGWEWIDDYAICISLNNNGGKIIYNFWNKSQSCEFGKGTRIWYSEDIIDYLDPKKHRTILVRENVAKGIASDTITYGFDFYRMDLATRVCSDEQQRYIKKYNVKETTKHLKKTGRPILNDVYKKCGETTMEGEVDKYLDLLDELGVSLPFSSPSQPVYIYDKEGNYGLNKEYLKKLRRRYYVGKNN